MLDGLRRAHPHLYNNGERVRMFVCVLLIFSVGSRTGRKLIFGMLGALAL